MFRMPARAIVELGDPLLRMVSAPVAGAAEVAAVLDDLRDTLHEFQRTHGFGRGISAVQIGQPKRLLYLEIAGRSYCLHNPVYEWRSDERFRLWDDCFSFPDLMVWLERHSAVRVRYTDEYDAPQVLEAEGAVAELLQHEIDHLDGVLAVDRAIDCNSFATRAEYERRYRATQSAPAASVK
jgi:peptide deformylase